jgi:hypothetical protein
VTARAKVNLLLAGLVCLNLAAWGARQLLVGAFDPVLRALHG